MANIYFKCECGKYLGVEETEVGRTVTCPGCGRAVTVRAPEVRWNCPKCGETLLASAEIAGGKVPCAKCQSSIFIPGSAQSLSARRPTPKPKVSKVSAASPKAQNATLTPKPAPAVKPVPMAAQKRPEEPVPVAQPVQPPAASPDAGAGSPEAPPAAGRRVDARRKCPKCRRDISFDSFLCPHCSFFLTGLQAFARRSERGARG